SLIASGGLGLYRWPIQWEALPGALHLHVGQPQPLEPPTIYLRQVVLSPDGRQVAVRRANGVLLLRLSDGRRLLLPQKAAECESISFSVDGRWVAAAAWPEDDAKVWDAETGQLVQILPRSDILNLVFSPNG